MCTMLLTNSREYSCVAIVIFCKFKEHFLRYITHRTVIFFWIRLLPLSQKPWGGERVFGPLIKYYRVNTNQ